MEEKDKLARGLKRSNVQDRAAWKIGCKKNGSYPLAGKTSRVPGERRCLLTLLEQMDDEVEGKNEDDLR